MKYIFLLLVPAFIFAQTAEQKQEIVATYSKADMDKAMHYFNELEVQRMSRVNAYLDQSGKAMYQVIDGKTKEVRDVLADGTVLYYENYNDGSAMTMRAKQLYAGGSAGLSLSGAGIEVGVWEAANGIPLQTHEDLTGRVTVIDGTTNVTFHATHVAGTIMSTGENTVFNQGRGIAYGASVRAANSSNDHAEMTSEAANGMLLSNHSYGYSAEDMPLWAFGAYGSNAFNIDFICRTYPYYLPVIAAGNDRASYAQINVTKGGFDLLTGDSTSKNAITVAAVHQVSNYTGPNSVQMSSFSNWGGTDDGRIKPDISAKGVGVYSTSNASNTAYASSQGTSMATPGITGLLALLQEHYNNVNGSFMLAATAKGLLLHTADEAGTHQGPDYKFGWGLPNGVKMASTITNNNVSSLVQETSINNGETQTFNVIANGDEPLKVSISWTDKPGTTNNGTEDLATPALVHDLDIKLTKDGVDYYPWKLDISNYNLAATRNSTNDVDNFERIDVDTPVLNDVYELSISHKGTISGGSQNFSLIITGGILEGLSSNEVAVQKEDIVVYPNPVKTIMTIKNSQGDNPWNYIEVLDTTSKLVHAEALKEGSSTEQIQLQKLVPGVYYLRIYTKQGLVHKKIIKK